MGYGKEMILLRESCLGSMVLVLCMFLGCAHIKPNASSPLLSESLSESRSKSQIERSALNGIHSTPSLWFKKMKGAITGLSISKNGQAILIAAAPDPDIEGSTNQHFLLKLNSEGEVVWKFPVKSPTRDQDISKDGSFVVISNYESQLQGIDAKGKTLWTSEGACRPQVLSEAKKILCYYDDDAEPRIGFDVLDWSGKRLFSHTITQDILALKVARDQKSLAIGLSKGKVVLFNSDFQPVWHRKVDGEVIDVSLSSKENLKVAVLYKNRKKDAEIVVFDHAGARVGSASPSFRPSQIEVSPNGDALFYYGNSPSGQFVASLSLSPISSSSLREVWKRGDPLFSDFSSSIHVVNDQVIMGLEKATPYGMEGHILSYNFKGELKWDVIPAVSDAGAYIYTHQIASGTGLLVVGMDDATVSAYRVK